MEIKRFNQLNEGRTELTKDLEKAQKCLDKLTKLKDEAYELFGGDDDMLDGFDAAESRIKELLKEIK